MFSVFKSVIDILHHLIWPYMCQCCSIVLCFAMCSIDLLVEFDRILCLQLCAVVIVFMMCGMLCI